MSLIFCVECKKLLSDKKKNIYSFYFYWIKEFPSIYLIHCCVCNTHVGVKFSNVCITCFGINTLENNKILEWIPTFKKTVFDIFKNNNKCNICNTKEKREQYWYYDDKVYYI